MYKENNEYKKSLHPKWKKGLKILNIFLIIEVQSTNPVVLNNSQLSVFQQNFLPIPDDTTKQQAAAY